MFTHTTMDPSFTLAVLTEVAHERIRQHDKFGEQNHPSGTGSAAFRDILALVRREFADALGNGRLTYAHILAEEFAEVMAESEVDKLRAELIQVAAVSVQWIESIDRNGGTA